MRGTAFSRRAFLRGGVTAGVGGLFAGCGARDDDETATPTRSPTTTPTTPNGTPSRDTLRDEFDHVVDMGDLSSVQTGKPIDGALSEHAADGTLLLLPSGRYQLEETWSFADFDRFGMLGSDTTIVPPKGFHGTLFDIGNKSAGNRFVFSDVTFDFSAPSTGARPLFAAVGDDLLVSDVSVRGTQDVDQDLFRFDVTEPDGTGVIARLSLPDGGGPPWSVTGCEVGDMNRGTLRFLDCHIAGFPDNGLYADPPEGVIEVIGGRYENNDISNVRVNADPGSVIRGVHVRCDQAPKNFENMRGIRLRGGDGISVVGCLIEMVNVTSSDGGVTVSHDMGRVEVRDTHVHVDAPGVNGVRVKSFGGDEDAGRITLDNVLITGNANEGAAIQVAGRNGYRFQNLCVLQYGDRRDGLRAQNADGTLTRSTVAVRGRPLQLTDSDVATTNLRVCRNPRPQGGSITVCERNCRQLQGRLDDILPTDGVEPVRPADR